MSQNNVFVATLTSKGQVTIPVEIRKELGLRLHDKIIFRLKADDKVEIERMPMSLEEAFGSVPPLNRPEQFEEIKQTAQEEREKRWLNSPA